MSGIGQHGLLDLYGCPSGLLRSEGSLKQAMAEAATAAGATILSAAFHRFGGHGGITGVLLLAESHISIHTWPEYRFAAADIFMCGRPDLEEAAGLLERALHARSRQWTQTPRGTRCPPPDAPGQQAA